MVIPMAMTGESHSLVVSEGTIELEHAEPGDDGGGICSRYVVALVWWVIICNKIRGIHTDKAKSSV